MSLKAVLTAILGGYPTVHQDIPASAVFLVIYAIGAASHMTIFVRNKRSKHKFFVSWGMFGLCVSRVVTCTLRIVWAKKPTNQSVAIAAQIFLNAGVLIVYIVALYLSTRLLRATQPKVGWNFYLAKVLVLMYVFMACMLVLLIAFTVKSFYTSNTTLLSVAHWIQRAAILYMLIFTVIALVFYMCALLYPRTCEPENFGAGSLVAKFTIMGATLFFALFLSGLRTAYMWAPSHLASNPPWYDTRATFYIIVLGFELAVIYLFLLTRVDKRFWVPNGSSKPGDYSRVGSASNEMSTSGPEEKGGV